MRRNKMHASSDREFECICNLIWSENLMLSAEIFLKPQNRNACQF